LFAVVSWPLATEGEELAAVVVQGASLDHISSKFGCLKKKKIELNASRGTSPVVEQRQATQYERFGQILTVQIGKLSARCQKVWKTKHLERGPFAAEGEELAAVVVQDAFLDHMSSDFVCLRELMTTRNC